MSLFISQAIADTVDAGTRAQGSAFGSMLMLVVFIVIFYLLLWRPQSKKAKQHRELINHLAKDDEVVTSGGIVGTINKLNDEFVRLIIADGVQIRVQKAAIVRVLPKGSMETSS